MSVPAPATAPTPRQLARHFAPAIRSSAPWPIRLALRAIPMPVLLWIIGAVVQLVLMWLEARNAIAEDFDGEVSRAFRSLPPAIVEDADE